MKRPPFIAIIIGFLLLSGAVVFTVYHLANRYLTNDSKAKRPVIAKCPTRGPTHLVKIQNNATSPQHTQANLCDGLTITNTDNQVRLMAFGPHDEHQPYDGITEQSLSKGQSLKVVLNQKGTYQFHDHIGDEAHGDFTVN